MEMIKKVDVIKLKVCKEGLIDYDFEMINNPKLASILINQVIGELDRECFVVINLNVKNEPCSIQICGIGTLNQVNIHPREVFKSAILTNTYRIIVAHNHPSGHIKPSSEDIKLTKELVKVGEILQIPVVDHVIVGNGGYYSFAEEGII